MDIQSLPPLDMTETQIQIARARLQTIKTALFGSTLLPISPLLRSPLESVVSNAISELTDEQIVSMMVSFFTFSDELFFELWPEETP